MKLKRVGFFRELRYGDEHGMSLKEAVCNISSKNEDKIVEYLNNGMVLCVTAGLVPDILDESKGIIGNLKIITDGEWAWPSDLSYYVKAYHVKLDVDFIKHIKKNDWIMPQQKDIDLLKLEL